MKNKILNITVYGHKMNDQSLIINSIQTLLNKAEIPFILKEENNASVFIENDIKTTTAVQIEQEEIIPITIDNKFSSSLKNVVSRILERRDFGNLENMVIPIDFSDNSINALEYGYKLSFDLGLLATVLHVYFPSSRDLKESTFAPIDYSILRKSQLDDLVEMIKNEWPNDFQTSALIQKKFKEGLPGDNIIDCAKEINSSYILMGTTGDTGLIKKWFGSVSTKVMNESKTPVILVPPGAKYHKINNILYAFDSYDIDKNCIDQLIEFANQLDSNIHFVHVRKEEENNPGYYLTDLLEDKISKDRITINQIPPKEISQALNDYSTKHEIDMIAFGTKLKSIFQLLFKESITRKMALQSTKPILILKS